MINVVFILMAISTLLLFIPFIKDNKVESKTLFTSVCLLFIISIIGIFCRDENLELALLIFIIGYIFLSISIYIIYSCFSCNKKIKAIFIGFNKYPSVTGKLLNFPIYKYDFSNVSYETQSLQDIKTKVLNTYKIGEEYEIYINSKNPKLCIASKKIHIIDFFMFIFGFTLTLLSIILLIDYLF